MDHLGDRAGALANNGKKQRLQIRQIAVTQSPRQRARIDCVIGRRKGCVTITPPPDDRVTTARQRKPDDTPLFCLGLRWLALI
jgi:hypothetical protein